MVTADESSTEGIREEGEAAIASARTLEELAQVGVDLFGKRSALAAAHRSLAGLEADQRKEAGRRLHEVRAALEAQLAARRDALAESERAALLAADRLDLTEVIPDQVRSPLTRGHLHLVSQARDELEDVFVGMGFEVAEGPEAETDWYNFEALNMPPAHPARGMYDTMYLDIGEPETVLLRTHTSPVQVHLMEEAVRNGTLPIHAVMPGKCFRLDTPDARHLPVFNQIEGLVVDRGITFGDLAGTIQTFTAAYFGRGHAVPPPPRVLPVHRALGRVRDHLRHLWRRRMPHLFEHRVGGARRLRDGRPGRLRRGRDRPRRLVRLRLRFRYRPAGAHAARDSRPALLHGERHPIPVAVLGTVRAPLSWLRDFAPFPDDTGALVAALDDLGLVVEEVDRVGQGLEAVVVSRVAEIHAIEGADRIRRIVVEAGGEPLDIVCGAFNFVVGDRVPLAPVGAVLPGGFEIGRRKMRGVLSNGMLCSGRELGLSDDGAGLLVLGEEVDAPPGTPLIEALGLPVDTVFDITVEGNRPDAWCMAGVARDLAARLGLPFELPEPPAPEPSGRPVADAASAAVEDPDLCPRLTVSVFTDVAVGPSPAWIAQRLILAGMRPINNVVDASNYVMLERGQPTHPYDLARLGGRGLVVRRAQPGEKVETLDGVTRTLGLPGRSLGDTGEDCLICDADNVAVGIAGIMGGASSEIADSTTEVLLEAAYFTPMAIARTSKRLGLRTEASARFERGCDPWGIDASIRRFAQLLGESVPALGVCDGILDRPRIGPRAVRARGAHRPRPAPDRRPAHPGRHRRAPRPHRVQHAARCRGPGHGGGADQSTRRAAGPVRDRRRH